MQDSRPHARGRHGRRQALRADAPQVRLAYTLSRDPSLTVPEICQHLHIARATFYRYVALARQEAQDTPRRENRKAVWRYDCMSVIAACAAIKRKAVWSSVLPGSTRGHSEAPDGCGRGMASKAWPA